MDIGLKRIVGYIMVFSKSRRIEDDHVIHFFGLRKEVLYIRNDLFMSVIRTSFRVRFSLVHSMACFELSTECTIFAPPFSAYTENAPE